MSAADYKVCHVCGSVMELCSTSKTIRFHGNELKLNGLKAYRCPNCGETVYSAEEVDKMERLARAFTTEIESLEDAQRKGDA